MLDKYKLWIKQNVLGDGYGQCKEIVEKMILTFPELKKIRGHYCCPVWGMRQHWWLKTQDDEIIDPTKEQFPSKGQFPYIELDESEPEPTGICPNCGDYVYDGSTCCSENCHISYVAYCSNPFGY